MDDLLLKGQIRGVEMKGGKFIKADHAHIYFEIPKDGELDSERQLKIIKDAFKESHGLSLKIKRI